jgi:membrane fusion protein, multidrug efflux system
MDRAGVSMRFFLMALVAVPVVGALWFGLGPFDLQVLARLRNASGAVAAQAVDPMAIPVVAALVEQHDVPLYKTGLGSVQAFNSVSISSRVDGQLIRLGFVEGQMVKAGGVIAEIDPRSYEASLRQSEAQLRNNRAKLSAVKGDFDRLEDLHRRGVATPQSYEGKRSEVEQIEASIEAAEADVDRAKLQVEYTAIRSPIDGRIGLKQVDVGNMIAAAERAPIAVVTQIRPIAVIFSLPQEDLNDVVKAMAAKRKLPVVVIGRDNRIELATGELTTIDNQIDAKSGTFKLKATFKNDDDALWPGQLVAARLLVDTRADAVVVAGPAVQPGPDGPLCFVIKADDTVELRSLRVVQIQDGVAMIASGLAPGERVVVDGQYRLSAGTRVKVTRIEPSDPKPGDAAEHSGGSKPPRT